MSTASPYVNTSEGARHARFDDCEHPERAFLEWARLHKVPRFRRGRRCLWRIADIDKALAAKTQPMVDVKFFARARRAVSGGR